MFVAMMKNNIYQIYDVWSSIKITAKNFMIVATLSSICVFLLSLISDIQAHFFFLGIALVLSFQSILIYKANNKYIINIDTGDITFPRSDVENSLIAIVLLYPYWNLMRTLTINSNYIENIYMDYKRAKKNHKYTINIVGSFGSANLQFTDRQKRDEVRNAIQQSVKKHTGKNIDRKVAEFN